MSTPHRAKLRRTSAQLLTPRMERRREWAAAGYGAMPQDAGIEVSRLEPLPGSLQKFLPGTGIADPDLITHCGGCTHRYAWCVLSRRNTGSTIVIWDIAPHQNLRYAVPASALGIQHLRPQIDIFFPYELGEPPLPFCVIVDRIHGKVVLLHLPNNMTDHTLPASGTPQFHTASLHADTRDSQTITAAAVVPGRGVVVGTAAGVVYFFPIDPAGATMEPEIRLTPKPSSTFINTMVSSIALPRLAFDWVRGRAPTAPTVQPVVALLYSPFPVGDEVLFAVMKDGQVIQHDDLAPNSGTRLQQINLGELLCDRAVGTDFAVATAALSFPPTVTVASPTSPHHKQHSASLAPSINLLIRYHCSDSHLPKLVACRMAIVRSSADEAALPVVKGPTIIGHYDGDCSLLVQSDPQLESDALLLVSKNDDRCQLVKTSYDATPESIVVRSIASRVIASTSPDSPLPEKLMLVTMDGSMTAPLPSPAHAKLRSVLQGTLSSRIDEAASQTDDIRGDLAAASCTVANSPIIDAVQWQSLDDSTDRSSTILASIREKAAKHYSIVVAARRRGVDANTFRVIANNSERIAVLCALRELQSSLYSGGQGVRSWYASELLHILSDFAKHDEGFVHNQTTHKLTPVQHMYSQADRVDDLFPFLARFVHREAGPADIGCIKGPRTDPEYMLLIGLVLDVAVNAIQRAQADLSTHGASQSRWSRATRLLDAFKELLEDLHVAVLRSADAAIATKLLEHMKSITCFVVLQMKAAGLKFDEPPSAMIQRLFLTKLDTDRTDYEKSAGFRYAHELAIELGEFGLLVELSFMLPDVDRDEELQQHHRQYGHDFLVALIRHLRSPETIPELLRVKERLGLSGDAFADSAKEVLPANHPLLYAIIGPSASHASDEEAAAALQRAGQQLQRDSCVFDASAPPLASKQLLRLKLAKFALSMATVGDRSAWHSTSDLTGTIDTSMMLVQLQREVLLQEGDEDAPAAPPHEILEGLLSHNWEGAGLHPVAGHLLAWAFPVSAIVGEQQHYAGRVQEIWKKVLTIPHGWWHAPEFEDFFGLPEQQQVDLVAKTTFFHVVRTARIFPRISQSAFRAGAETFDDSLLSALPGLSKAVFGRIVQIAMQHPI